MQLYQWANLVTSLMSAAIFWIVSRRTPDRISRYAMRVWVAVMCWAALSGPIVAFTNYDAIARSISMVATPIGWTAVAIYAARRLTHG